MHMTLIPAYGRDYKSKAEVVSAFIAGKDFEAVSIGSAGYIGYEEVKDMAKSGEQHLNIRYKKQTQVAVLRVDKEGNVYLDGKPFKKEETPA